MIFSPEQVSALRTLGRIWSTERFVLIGASALRFLMGSQLRETHDLDLALAVTLDGYRAGIEKESEWSRHPKREQTWIAPGDVQIDVIPLGDDQNPATVLRWPQSGFEMSLVGMRLAFAHSVTIEPVQNLTIRVAPLEVIALLKMVAYLDRPSERDRDLADIAYILDGYAKDFEDQRYGDEVIDLELTYDEVSPFLLGRRLAAIVNRQEREAILRFIGLVKQSGGAHAAQARMLVSAPPGWRRDPEELLLRIAAFENGFSATPAENFSDAPTTQT